MKWRPTMRPAESPDCETAEKKEKKEDGEGMVEGWEGKEREKKDGEGMVEG